MISRDENGKSRGFAILIFTKLADAKNAIDKMNGFSLANRPIKCEMHVENLYSRNILNKIDKTLDEKDVGITQ